MRAASPTPALAVPSRWFSIDSGRLLAARRVYRTPQTTFLDIRMPGMTALEIAHALAEDWPTGDALPLVVFVTAYDQYALQAFEQEAVDDVLKPLQPERLAQTCERAQAALRQRSQPAPDALDGAFAQLRELLGAPGLAAPAAPRLAVIQASVGNAVHPAPVGEVLYFEAADASVRVITAQREYPIRMSLRELLPQLDAQCFWQVHRGTVVRADAIATAVRDVSGKVQLSLRGHADKLVARRLYARFFKAM